MDLKRGLTFPTLDPQWIVKVLIGTLISLVPILNFVGVGYALDVTRNVNNGQETPLPEWNDFGGQFIRGLLAVIIQFIWSLPLLVLVCPFAFILAGSVDADTGQLSGVGSAAVACGPILLMVVGLVLAPFIMAANTRFAITNQFSEAMPGPVIREVRSNMRPWFTILAVVIGIGILAVALNFCTLGFGSILFIPLSFYMQLVVAHWYAQAHRQSTGGVPTPPSMV
ncbi:MAG TPA: DUF4013 domain-containing protein [Herpetosiphonaceae bacterium]